MNDFNKHKIWKDIVNAKVVHIGYHKTATTYFQKEVFPQFGLGGLIVSSEGLSGDIIKGDSFDNIDKIYKINPNANILITIRSQKTMLGSAYWLYVKSGGSESFDYYVKSALKNGKFQYEKLYKAYMEKFPKVKVVLLEDLKKDKFFTLASIQKFIGINSKLKLDSYHSNASPSDFHIFFMKTVNRIFNSSYCDTFTPKIMHRASRVLVIYLASIVNKIVVFFLGRDVNFYQTERYNDQLKKYYSKSNQELFLELKKNKLDYDYP